MCENDIVFGLNGGNKALLSAFISKYVSTFVIVPSTNCSCVLFLQLLTLKYASCLFLSNWFNSKVISHLLSESTSVLFPNCSVYLPCMVRHKQQKHLIAFYDTYLLFKLLNLYFYDTLFIDFSSYLSNFQGTSYFSIKHIHI